MSYLNWRRYISAATILGGNLEKVVSEMTIKHLSAGGYFINGQRSSLFFMLLKRVLRLLEVLAVRRDFLLFSCFHGSQESSALSCSQLIFITEEKKLKELLLCLDSRDNSSLSLTARILSHSKRKASNRSVCAVCELNGERRTRLVGQEQKK